MKVVTLTRGDLADEKEENPNLGVKLAARSQQRS